MKFKDLTQKSIETLKPHITFWSFDSDLNLDSEINDVLSIATTGFNRYIAGYAINYAVLLDDKELAIDLCKNGARLDVTDIYHKNKNPLELAVDYGRAGIAEILIKYGAKLDTNKNTAIPSCNPCCNPSRFFWTLNERYHNREADYQAVKQVVHSNKRI